MFVTKIGKIKLKLLRVNFEREVYRDPYIKPTRLF